MVNFCIRKNSVLDLILIDEVQCILTIFFERPSLCLSDHCCIQFLLLVEFACDASSYSSYRYYSWRTRADYIGMNNYFTKFDWFKLFCNFPSTLDMWSAFIDVIFMLSPSMFPPNFHVIVYAPKSMLTACTLQKYARHLPKSCSTGGSTKPVLTSIHLN